MRGAWRVYDINENVFGITPACAGSMGRLGELTDPDKDHPRVCGEHVEFPECEDPAEGSPPRVRGAYA